MGSYYCVRTERKHKNHYRIQTKLHKGVIYRKNSFSLCKVVAHVLGGSSEFLLFVLLANVGFYNANALYVLLNRTVDSVVFFKHTLEKGHGF